jgi:tellurite methyltransferase
VISPVSASGSICFFDAQFRRQDEAGEFALNPFEARALPYLGGSVLDLGCGLGNLAIAAARRGASVLALDASEAAIRSLTRRAGELRLDVTARCVELSDYVPEREYECVAAIGLFMFFPCEVARRQLARALAAVRPDGNAVVNVLVEGTTYMEMFDPVRGYCLALEDDLPRQSPAWQVLDDRAEQFDAPGGTVKRFRTTIARRSAAAA